MKKVKLLIVASTVATIGFFAISTNESVAGSRICSGGMKLKNDGTVKCGLLGEGCQRACAWYEIK